MRTYLFLFLLIPFFSAAQINDSFSDGDFTADPVWSGTGLQFMVNPEYQLQLNSSGEGISYLSTGLSMNGLTEWRILVKLAFSPSTNNFARVYLVADQANTSEPLNGYFLQFGESGSADAIELYRQSGTATYFVCRGNDGLIAAAFTMRVRVIRTDMGVWSVYADPLGGEDFQFQASGEDPVWDAYTHTGIYCKYTSSNSNRFYFDDVYAGPPVIDEIRPVLLSAKIAGQKSLRLTFSEAVNEASASNTENYRVDQGIGQPLTAVRDANVPSVVNLTFAGDLAHGIVYTIQVLDVSDLAGNLMEPITLPFAFYQVSAHDVLINEIMADPDPPVGLPGYEYLELYNRSELPVQLENWQLTVGSGSKVLTNRILAPGAFLILCSSAGSQQLSEYGDVMAFSGFSLVNTGSELCLRDADGSVIHTIAYTDKWYNDNLKKEGGWSLELIDPLNPCGSDGNWRASMNSAGGTPGSENSVLGSNPDNQAPYIERVSITGESVLQVFFNETMDSVYLSNAALYTADNGLGNPVSVILHGPGYRSVSLLFSGIIRNDVVYTLRISPGLSDCAGNHTTDYMAAKFAVPVPIGPNDIVINEVLSDPTVFGSDFVEVYNRSDKVVDLKDLMIASRDAVTGEPEQTAIVSQDGRLFFPGEYVVITEDSEAVKASYYCPSPGSFSEVASMPSLANEAGTVVLFTKSLEIADEFSYVPSMHYALLNSTDGVSLERVNYDRPSGEAGNWHSAAQSAGFATPGYRNSQYLAVTGKDDEISISPEIFSPDQDGYNDQLGISCNFSEPGTSVTIRIFDSNGRLIRNLVKNEVAGTAGLYTWDGITEEREKAPIGIYIIFVEVFNLSGKVKEFKKTAVLGGRL